MFDKKTVELTKIYYYDQNDRHRNLNIFTITKESLKNKINREKIIKRNVFGHKWILKINENHVKGKKKSAKFYLYLLVTFSLLIAIVFGIIFFIDAKHSNKVPTIKIDKTIGNVAPATIESTNNTTDSTMKIVTDETLMEKVCKGCKRDEVCINTRSTPICIKITNENDPTGCGGLCRIDYEYCKLLDDKIKLYECFPDRKRLECDDDQHNCGNMCIGKIQVCDGYIHCEDKSDEKNCECDLSTNFHCGNSTSCIDKWKKCDGRVDCWDASDEKNCYDQDCAPDEFACRGNACVPIERMCDGVTDCVGGEDESIGCLKKMKRLSL